MDLVKNNKKGQLIKVLTCASLFEKTSEKNVVAQKRFFLNPFRFRLWLVYY